MSLELTDPRKYSTAYPESNRLINQAVQDLANQDDNQLMIALLEDVLKQGDDQLLSVAYNLAPSQAVADYLWQTLQQVITKPATANYTYMFAVPLVVVVGSSETISLPTTINGEKLTKLLIRQQILADASSCRMLNKLYTLDGIAGLLPSQLYQWAHELTDINTWNAEQVACGPITNQGEGIYLRFLIGLARVTPELKQPLKSANFNKLGMQLVELLTQDLATSGVTIFPLPFAPVALSAAAVIGEHHRKEISVTVSLSNIVKKMRLAGKDPEVKVSTRNEEIVIEVWEVGASVATASLTWSVQRADDFALIRKTLDELLTDMRLTGTKEQKAVADAYFDDTYEPDEYDGF